MSNTIKMIVDKIKRNPYWILLILFALWMCIGIFPLQCYETDGNEIILGCDVMYQEGWSLPPVYSYEYRMQPLMTILIVGLKHLMPFLTCEQIYCLLTAIASFIFLIGCVAFAEHVTNSSKTKILVAAMLLPEMYAIAMYPNTAIPSVACFIWALVLMTRKRYCLTALLMCIAVLFRLDIVIVFPAILPLLIFEGKSLVKSLLISIIYGVVIVGAGLFLFWLMNAEALRTYGSYQQWSQIITPTERFLAISGFYSIVYVVLLPIGLIVISLQRRWKELLLVLVPILLLHYVYSGFGNASKHFLYNAPFVIIIGVRALSWLEDVLKNKPVPKWACLILVVLLMIVSVRKRSLDMPWLQTNPLHQAGMVMPLYSSQTADFEVSVGIGAGYQLITNDENMLASGHLFYSWYIHSIKQALSDWREQQVAVLDTAQTSNILTFEWGASAPVASELLHRNHQFLLRRGMPEEYRFSVTSPEHQLHFWRIVLPGQVKSDEEMASYINHMCKKFHQGDKYIIAASNHYGTSHFLDELVQQGMLSKKAERLYQVMNPSN